MLESQPSHMTSFFFLAYRGINLEKVHSKIFFSFISLEVQQIALLIFSSCTHNTYLSPLTKALPILPFPHLPTPHPPGTRSTWLYGGDNKWVVVVFRCPSSETKPKPNIVCLEFDNHVLRMGDNVCAGSDGESRGEPWDVGHGVTEGCSWGSKQHTYRSGLIY